MRAKQTLNKKVNSFSFSWNLLNGDVLERILKLYELETVYIFIFDLHEKSDLPTLFNECQIKTFKDMSGYHTQNIAVEVSVTEVSHLIALLAEHFSEMTVWSTEQEWERWLETTSQTDNFFTFSATPENDDAGFYLDFNPYECNQVEIICDLSFHHAKNIKKEHVMDLLYEQPESK